MLKLSKMLNFLLLTWQNIVRTNQKLNLLTTTILSSAKATAADADDNGDADESGNNGNGEEHDNGEDGDESKNKSPHSNKDGEDSDEDGDGNSDMGDTSAGDQSNKSNESYAPGDFVPESETDAAWSNAQNDLLTKDVKIMLTIMFTNLLTLLIILLTTKKLQVISEKSYELVLLKLQFIHKTELHGQI